jgi:hypothetical protein
MENRLFNWGKDPKTKTGSGEDPGLFLKEAGVTVENFHARGCGFTF